MTGLLIQFIDLLFTVLLIAIFARVLLSWFSVGESNPLYPVVKIVNEITEPILAPIRAVLPNFGFLDLSPMVALLLMSVIQRVLKQVLA